MMRKLFLFYLSNILPVVGSIISGDKFAYRYLNQTVEEFPYGREFCRMIEKAGFSNVYEKPLTFGISTIYCGEKLI
ncbi:class I SAM-dependent methyltransferase [candidate division KSB1 bacterium]|nr:class I SAM-dependent methyltransferase [candidate division KSB1 bacterium]